MKSPGTPKMLLTPSCEIDEGKSVEPERDQGQYAYLSETLEAARGGGLRRATTAKQRAKTHMYSETVVVSLSLGAMPIRREKKKEAKHRTLALPTKKDFGIILVERS